MIISYALKGKTFGILPHLIYQIETGVELNTQGIKAFNDACYSSLMILKDIEIEMVDAKMGKNKSNWKPPNDNDPVLIDLKEWANNISKRKKEKEKQ